MKGSGRRSALVTIASASFIFSGVLLHSKDIQQASLPREWSSVHGDGTNERCSRLKEIDTAMSSNWVVRGCRRNLKMAHQPGPLRS